MKSLIRICKSCGSYTMKEICPNCMGNTVVALPPKFSPNDRFQRFRLKEVGEGWKKS
ncbi:MAG: RNA-protein complex protein Nop10 [Thermoplasmataceae archaeon]